MSIRRQDIFVPKDYNVLMKKLKIFTALKNTLSSVVPCGVTVVQVLVFLCCQETIKAARTTFLNIIFIIQILNFDYRELI